MMVETTSAEEAPFGTWPSSITAELVSDAGIGLSDLQADGGALYWLENRPQDGGRLVINRLGESGDVTELTPAPFNVRSRVHEYGGGAISVNGGLLYFSNFADQRIYRQTPGAEPTPVTADGPYRFADYVRDTTRNRLIAVREDHSTG